MTTIEVLNAGFVELTNISGPTRRADAKFDADMVDVATTARVSYGGDKVQRTREQNIKLTRRLWNDKHTSPFERISLHFNIKLPILVQRQWTRHRTWRYVHVNEISRRYAAEPVEYYHPSPDGWRRQSKSNKQGSEGLVDSAVSIAANSLHRAFCSCHDALYSRLLNWNITRELARVDMPVSAYTRMAVTMDLLTFQHFLDLRSALDAQWEIQQYAKAMHSLAKQHLPGYTEVFGE